MTDPAAAGSPRWGGPVTPLRYGRWTLEVRGDEVADISFDGVTLLRAVRPVVRDRDWNTVPVHVRDHTTSPAGTGLRTSLDFRSEVPAQDPIRYAGTLQVTLSDDELVVDFEGEPEAPFDRNRIGLVVLHRADEAGRAVEVRHPDGRRTSGRWPQEIRPHQPFADVAGFRWTRDGVTATLDLAGEVFETEDQRNWTDASFKTYSTPLTRPFPVRVGPGDVCRQQVRLRVSGRASRTAAAPAEAAEVVVSPDVVGTLPPLSLAAALYPPPTSGLHAPGSATAGYETVLVELTGPEQRWAELLAAAATQAVELAAELDVWVVTADPAAVGRTAALLAGRPVRRVGVFDPSTHLSTGALWSALTGSGLGSATELVGGTRAHFTELNRGLAEVPSEVPALTFSLTPQMHARELPHLLDSLATQRTVVDNAVRLSGGRPLLVGPVTLARRFNAVATGPAPDPAVDASRATDELQGTAFAAAWTLASVAALSVPGVAGLCYYETAGPRGVLDGGGGLTPAGAVLDRLAGWRGRGLLAVTAPSGLAALAVAGPAGAEVAVANLAPTARQVRVRGPGGRPYELELAPWQVEVVSLGAART